MLDVLIKDGRVIDGTGRPAVRADVGIREGRIVVIGAHDEAARRRIDADGHVVAPGFIDVHTHYDAQVMWDSSVSPSSLHGVTTVIGGNCGFTIAPVDEGSANYVMRMLACVEGMPAESLEAVLDFGWRTFPEWLAKLDGRLAVNAGFLTGHSTIRRLVMGEAWQGPANARQLDQMKVHVAQSVLGGALGFSSSWGTAHSDHLGNPVPSRYATAEELIELASVLRSHPGTVLEFIPPSDAVWPDEIVDVMIEMSRRAQTALNWNLLTVGAGTDRAANEARLAAGDRAAERGAEIVALTVPIPTQLRVNLLSTIVYNSMDVWRRVLTLPDAEKRRALADSSVRKKMAAAVEDRQRQSPSPFFELDRMTVLSVSSTQSKQLEGRTVGEIAGERGIDVLDAFLDVALADNLLTCFQSPVVGDDEESWRERADYWRDTRVLVGGSDAGAHLDMLSTFAFFTDFVGPTVRDRRLLSLEDAVHEVTDVPARLYGLRDRGRLVPGSYADVVVFDPDSISTGQVVLRNDMPQEQYRLFANAVGIDHVLVNGIEIVDHGELTGSAPGRIFRSGRDTGDPPTV